MDRIEGRACLRIGSYFSDIIVVESLRTSDMKTGKVLYEALSTDKMILEEGIGVSLETISSALEFCSLLHDIGNRVRATRRIPILHLELHGGERGFQFADNSIADWDSIKQGITDLNIILQNHLLITVAACSGAYLVKIIMPTERSPVFAVVGPVIPVTDLDALCGYHAFFKTLIASGNGDDALNALNIAHTGDKRYVLMSSEHLFMKVFKNYMTTYCTGEGLQHRISSLCDKALSERPCLQGPNRKHLADRMAHEFADTKSQFEKFKKHFFMHDLFERNKERFNPDYESMLRVKG